MLTLIPKLSESEFKKVAQFVELNHANFHLRGLKKEIKETRYSEAQYTCPVHVVKKGLSIIYVVIIINPLVAQQLHLLVILKNHLNFGSNI